MCYADDHEFERFGGRLAVVDAPVIQVVDGDIVCLRMTTDGYYKCYRQDYTFYHAMHYIYTVSGKKWPP